MDFESALGLKNEISSLFRIRSGDGRRNFALGVTMPGAEASDFGIAVRARSKAALSENDLRIIEARAGGQVGVRYTGPITASAGIAAAAPGATERFGIGASVGHPRCKAGTLGLFARRNSDQAIGFVSANHIIAAEDRGRDNDEILYPAPADKGKSPRDIVGRLCGDYPRLSDKAVRVDCAFGRLVKGREYNARSLDGMRMLSGDLVTSYDDPLVSKIGRTTGLTHGRISAVELDEVWVDYATDAIRFDGQIEVQSDGIAPFTLPGDSGSLVFTTAGCNPLGLVFANSAAGGPGNLGLTYVHPIDVVLTALGVTLLA